jgi:hypothetical protein
MAQNIPRLRDGYDGVQGKSADGLAESAGRFSGFD